MHTLLLLHTLLHTLLHRLLRIILRTFPDILQAFILAPSMLIGYKSPYFKGCVTHHS